MEINKRQEWIFKEKADMVLLEARLLITWASGHLFEYSMLLMIVCVQTWFSLHASIFESHVGSRNEDTRTNNYVRFALWPEEVTSRKRGSPSELSSVPAVALVREARTWDRRLEEEGVFIASFQLP